MTNSTTDGDLMTIPQAARRLAISRRTLEREIAGGRFPRPMKIGSASRVSETDLQTYLERLARERSRAR